MSRLEDIGGHPVLAEAALKAVKTIAEVQSGYALGGRYTGEATQLVPGAIARHVLERRSSRGINELKTVLNPGGQPEYK